MNRTDPAELIAHAIQGDLSAFEALVHQHSPAMLRFIRGILGDEHDAEDIAQQVWIRIYQNLHVFDERRGAFLTWLFQIARNQSLNTIRARGRSPISFQTPVPEPNSISDPLKNMIMREEFALLDQVLAQLPADQRTAWILSELDGLSQAEIAEIEQIPTGTVKSRVARAKASLRRQLSSSTPTIERK
ncbi:RNA polymerase sigma factor [Neorhodopirellula pilleata]|uniref:ECF RNA polymerase sigma factor SigW n=1 Tax=Neorhodopirellula pilleata TaxID=2714738 RepID=A0A5C6ADI0_9BACT|nr:RNA polymerase sigma factor [Neorhodopirellula pilleata]TWT97358.1 ECF RNA polymerase sigma factor SigW [Neorhodopirellula pilleata]